ncbi:DUF547 domain-containing protein [Thermodesulfobacteriota bacterium]
MGPRKCLFLPLLGILLVAGLLGFVCPAGAAAVNHDIYASLLAHYVKNGIVDYAGFKKEEAKLDKYLKLLENTDLKTLSRNDQFAFYVNAYNAWTIKLILTGYPEVKSIKDLGGFFGPWKKKFVRIDKKITTLDHVEHDILRPQFKDPRVHFAVNCASKGCPPLLSEPYQGSKLDEQLNRSTRAFISNPQRNYLDGNKLHVSSIFKWFEEDFDHDIPGFFLKYAEGNLKKELQVTKGKIKVKYLKYDWSLNGK